MNIESGLLAHTERAGVYASSSAQLDAAGKAATSIGFDCWQLDLSATHTSSTLLRELGRALHFPQWYGENWDALSDCLTDLSWSNADGFALILRDCASLQTAQAALWQTLIELLGEVSDFWRDNGIAFWVLTDDTTGALPRLPQDA